MNAEKRLTLYILMIVLLGGSSNALAESKPSFQLHRFTSRNSGLSIDRVSSLAVQNDVLWVGGVAGLALYDQGQWQTFTEEDGLPDNGVLSLAVQDETLWVGTIGGLARYDGEEWQTFTEEDGLPHNWVSSLAVHGEVLWVGTGGLFGGGGGLARYDGEEWQTFTEEDGLPHNEVRSLAVQGETLWVGTGGGLARYHEGQWGTFTTNDGLPNVEVKSLAVQNETLWVGTAGGLGRLDFSEFGPLLRFVQKEKKKVEQSRLTFEVSPFDPTYQTSPHEFRYHWELKGPIEEEKTTQQYFFETPQLENGSYRLRVTAIDNHGYRSKPLSHNFEVDLPDPIVEPTGWGWQERVAIGSGGAGFLYLVALPLLLLFYQKSDIVRSAVNSGCFDKFPLLHKTILNSDWGRRRVFQLVAKNSLQSAEVPEHYIPQAVYRVGTRSLAPVPLDDKGEGLSELFQNGRRVLILGRSGTGKSVLLRYLLRQASRRFLEGKDPRLPVLLDLRTNPPLGRSMEDLVRDQIHRGGVQLSDDVLDFQIFKGKFLLFVDSLNEIKHEELQALLHPFLNRDSGNWTLMASQIDQLDRQDVPSYRMKEVTEEQARHYLKEVTGSDDWDRLPPEAKKMAVNPQDLSLLAEIVTASEDKEFPTARVDLYKRLLRQDSTLSQWVSNYQPEIHAIYGLAFRMFEQKLAVEVEEIGQWVLLELKAKGIDDENTTQAVVEAVLRSRLFREEIQRGEVGLSQRVVTFQHELIGKFLAARYLQGCLLDPPENTFDIAGLAAEERWMEVFCFLIDELSFRETMNSFLNDLLSGGTEQQLRLVGYALGNKAEMIDQEVREYYYLMKVEADRRETQGTG